MINFRKTNRYLRILKLTKSLHLGGFFIRKRVKTSKITKYLYINLLKIQLLFSIISSLYIFV